MNRKRRRAGAKARRRDTRKVHGPTPADSKLQTALSCHQAGRLAEARRIYAEFLSEEPSHAGALHFLGVVKFQQGDAGAAAELAVGLAALDAWPEIRALDQVAAERYSAALTRLPGGVTAPGFGRRVVNFACNIVLRQAVADQVIQRLNAAGIEARQWLGKGCHRHPAYADCPRTALPETEFLGERVIGLPYYPDITAAEIELVVDSLAAALSQNESRAPFGAC